MDRVDSQMNNTQGFCHGQHDNMISCSEHIVFSRTDTFLLRLRLALSNALWHLRTKGPLQTLRLTMCKFLRFFQAKETVSGKSLHSSVESGDEILDLKPGDFVEVKSEEEILATLDKNRCNRGLLWMAGMNRFCGKRYRVFKRLELMLLENTKEYRKVKNTVLLEGVMCDGQAFNGCDRSCFHFWREVWLKRV